MTLRAALLASSILLSAASASPFRLAKRDDEYVIDSQGDARPEFTPSYVGSVEVTRGNEITITNGQTVESSFEVGAELGLSVADILSVGVSVSVSESAGTSTETGTSLICPDDLTDNEYTCAAVVTPNLWQINGHVIHRDGDAITGQDTYTVTSPRTGADGFALVDYGVCICPNPDGMIYPEYEPREGIINCPGSCGSG